MLRMKKQLVLALFLGLVGSPSLVLAEVSSMVEAIQGSEADVKKPLLEVGKQTEEVFKTMGIQVTSNKVEDSGVKQIIRGRKGENTVEVQLSQKAADQTHLTVVAKKGLVALNKDLAQQVIEQIIRSN
jgi:hypothetical protein